MATTNELADLRKEVAELREEVARLKARGPDVHYHYHGATQLLGLPSYLPPTLPSYPGGPRRVTCGGVGGSADADLVTCAPPVRLSAAETPTVTGRAFTFLGDRPLIPAHSESWGGLG